MQVVRLARALLLERKMRSRPCTAGGGGGGGGVVGMLGTRNPDLVWLGQEDAHSTWGNLLSKACAFRCTVVLSFDWYFSIEQMSIEQSAGMPTSCARQVLRGGHTCSMAWEFEKCAVKVHVRTIGLVQCSFFSTNFKDRLSDCCCVLLGFVMILISRYSIADRYPTIWLTYASYRISFRCEALAKAQQLSMLLSLPWYVWVKHEIRVDLSEQRPEVYWAQRHLLHGTCWDLRRAVRWLGTTNLFNALP